MAFSDYSATPGNNTSIAGQNIAPGGPPSAVGPAVRQIMADGKALADKLYKQVISVREWGAIDDNSSDATAALQKAFDEAPLGCDLIFPPPSTPDFYYRITSGLTLRRKINLVGNGARLLGVFPSSSDSPANDLLTVNVEDEADRDARNLWIAGFRDIAFLSGGRHALRVANAAPNIAHIGLVIERCKISAAPTGAGYAIRLDGIGTHANNVIRNCQIENGIMLSCADGTTVHDNNIYGIKPGVSLDLVDGAYSTAIENNVITARDGALLWLNGDEVTFAGNQCEQFPGYGANQSMYKAQITIIGQTTRPIRDSMVINNNFGGGGNCEAPIVVSQNARDILFDQNVFRIGTLNARNRDLRFLAASVQGMVLGSANEWRGNRPPVSDPGYAALIDDAGTATRGVWHEVTNGDLGASWTVIAGGGWRWMLNQDGIVLFDGGLVAGGVASGTIVYTFPVGARPRQDRLVSAVTQSGAATFWMRASGALEVVTATASNQTYFGDPRGLIRTTYETGTV